MDNRQTSKTEIVLAKPHHASHLANMSKRLIEQDLPWHNWTTKRMNKAIRRHDNVTLLCKRGATILGFASMQFGDETAHLNLLAVEVAFQRAGNAAAMLAWLEESCLVAGIRRVVLECRAKNLQAIRFYEAQGFERRETVPHYYCGIETALRMKKDLIKADTA
ncbi:MAG: GNAT family N-acetyltransferase [Gammaproteobacteria bacterium]